MFWEEVRRYGVTVVYYAGEMCRKLVDAPPVLGEGLEDEPERARVDDLRAGGQHGKRADGVDAVSDGLHRTGLDFIAEMTRTRQHVQRLLSNTTASAADIEDEQGAYASGGVDLAGGHFARRHA